MKTIPLVYVMSPYTDKDPRVRRRHYCSVEAYTGGLMVRFPHAMFYSPIVYCHPIAVNHGLPFDINYWRKHDLCMIVRSQLGIVFMEDGWKKSEGIAWELDQFETHQTPVIHDIRAGGHKIVGEALSQLA